MTWDHTGCIPLTWSATDTSFVKGGSWDSRHSPSILHMSKWGDTVALSSVICLSMVWAVDLQKHPTSLAKSPLQETGTSSLCLDQCLQYLLAKTDNYKNTMLLSQVLCNSTDPDSGMFFSKPPS